MQGNAGTRGKSDAILGLLPLRHASTYRLTEKVPLPVLRMIYGSAASDKLGVLCGIFISTLGHHIPQNDR